MKLIYIVGYNRSGTTLLSKLLSLQPHVITVGELLRLNSYILNNKKCTCGSPIRHCHFWKQIFDLMSKDISNGVETRIRHSSPHRKISNTTAMLSAYCRTSMPLQVFYPDQINIARNCMRITNLAATISRAEIVVDCSKSAEHFLRLWLIRNTEVLPIYMVRDGRAVVNSVRRHGDGSIEKASIGWVDSIKAMQRLQRITNQRGEYLFYEDLCRAPDTVLNAMFGRHMEIRTLNLSLLEDVTSHSIGGGAFDTTKEIRIDERWKNEMTRRDLDTFERIAGETNGKLGYTD